MKVYYSVSGEDYEGSCENPQMMVASKGSYIFLGADENVSSYNGIAFLDTSSYEMIKVVHDIRVTARKVTSILSTGGSVERIYDGCQERLFFNEGIACYHLRGSGKLRVLFDVRDIYDLGTKGREHEIALQGGKKAIVRCRGKEFLVLSSVELSAENEWIETKTPFDRARGGESSWWVYDGLSASAEHEMRIVVAPVSMTSQAETSISDDTVWERKPVLDEEPVALAAAKASLRGLITSTPGGDKGILAGLPWFFQLYTRDEAISLGAFIVEGQYELARDILLREISHVLDDGRIPNRFPDSEIGSADGVGWAFFRLSQLFHGRRSALSDNQWDYVGQQLKEALRRLSEEVQENLVFNGWKETWMDTTGRYPDGRPGARIEIQALTLAMLRFCHEVCVYLHDPEAEYYHRRELLMLTASRELLFDKEKRMIYDGYQEHHRDGTIRPNLFLACYVYPGLLRREEWKEVFDKYLVHLFLDWGGFSSIDKEHLMFHERHTGFNDDSYHRGDSWYFLNNIAAICLLRTDPSYRELAVRIRDASRRDLLDMGALGHASEISSACEQEAVGCVCQAWSASTFIELERELEKTGP